MRDINLVPAVFNTYFQPIREYLDLELTEIAINEPGTIWLLDHNGWRHEPIKLSRQQLSAIATTLAGNNSTTIDSTSPYLSAAIPVTGERVQVVIPPAVVSEQFSITIRKPSVRVSDINTLNQQGVFDMAIAPPRDLQDFEKQLLFFYKEKNWLDFFKTAILTERNIMICGKTGSGKTHIAKAFAAFIPVNQRVITVEDVHEFSMGFRNKVHLLFSRDGSPTAKEAMTSCLRMSPDRILFSEVRGDEAWPFIRSIGSAHPGALSTMHANSTLECFEQLVGLVKDTATGAHLDIPFLQRRLYSTLDIVVSVKNRKITEVYYDPEKKYSNMA